MKTIFLAHAYANTPVQFHTRMMDLLRKLSSLDTRISVRGCIQYPEVPHSNVHWFETYRPEIYGSDLVILVCDYGADILETVARARSFSSGALWCFMPRSVPVCPHVAEQVNIHRSHFQEKSVQAVYPYDSDEEIVCMVKRSIYDFHSSRHKITQILAHHAGLIRLPKGKPTR